MSGDQIANLVYLGLLGVALAIGLLVRRRIALRQMTQSMLAWGLIFAAALGIVGLWQEIDGTLGGTRAALTQDGALEIPRSVDGHYYVTLEINGAPTRFIIDTGATAMVLTRQAAERAGLAADELIFFDVARTANGEVRTAPVTLDEVALGPFTDRRFRAYVNGGQMDTSLLGMEYLSRFDRVEISGGRMVLER